jgi:hypothetical protein
MPTLDSNKTTVTQGSQPSQNSVFVPGTILCARYRIVSLLGRGGMGEVYRAEDLKLGNAVALKFLASSMQNDSEALAQLHREVRNARQVSHPGVCRVYDIGEADGQTFLTMEYIDGEDFASLLRRIGRLPGDKALEAAHQLCAGLAAAHEAGLLHRDLKPGNIMLDARGRVRITDFGLALDTHSTHERREIAGTPAYMSPEQITAGETSVSSDIYSLGMVLYEIFTGRLPYEPGAGETWRQVHLESSPRALSSVVKDIDPSVESAILCCLQKDPARRPASALEVAVALPSCIAQTAAVAATTPNQNAAITPRESAERATSAAGAQENGLPAATGARGRPAKAWAWTATALGLAVLLTVAYFLWTGKRPRLPFEHFTIERATDSDQVRSTAISPDGRYLATVVRSTNGDQGLWVHDVATRSDRPILQDSQYKYEDLIFSPDGSYIYFRVPALGTARPEQEDVYRIPMFGGRPALVIQNVDGPISFTPGNGRICMYRQNIAEGGSQFFSTASDGGDQKLLLAVKTSFPTEPACSPDALHAAFFDFATPRLEVLDFTTGATRILWSKSGHYLGDIRWESHGNGIFAIASSLSNYAGQPSFISHPGMDLHPITNDLDDYFGISLTADSKTLATTQVEENIRFEELPLSASSSERPHLLPAMLWFTWLDNSRIVGSGNNSVLKVANLLNDEVSTLDVDKSHIFMHPSLCSEQTVVAVGNTQDGENPGLFLMRLDGSMVTQLTHKDRQFFPQCTSDGKWLFYADTSPIQQFIVRVPFHNGVLDEAGTQKAADGFSWFDLSPDGTMLAVDTSISPGGKDVTAGGTRTENGSGLSVISTETLKPIKTFPPAAGRFGYIAFAADNKSVYYSTMMGAGSTIWRQPLVGSRDKVIDFPSKTVVYLRASPDNTRLGVLTREPHSHAVILRESH